MIGPVETHYRPHGDPRIWATKDNGSGRPGEIGRWVWHGSDEPSDYGRDLNEWVATCLNALQNVSHPELLPDLLKVLSQIEASTRQVRDDLGYCPECTYYAVITGWCIHSVRPVMDRIEELYGQLGVIDG